MKLKGDVMKLSLFLVMLFVSLSFVSAQSSLITGDAISIEVSSNGISISADNSSLTGNAVNVVDTASVTTNNTNITNSVDSSSGTGNIKDTIKSVEKTSGYIIGGKWGKLGEQWGEFLINKTFVGGINSAFKKGDIVFVVLTGSHYSLSVLTLFGVMLWFFFFMSFSNILINFSRFNAWTSFIIGLALSIVIAQFKVYAKISVFMVKLVFSTSGLWGIVSFVFLIILYFAVMFYIGNIIRGIGGWIKEQVEKGKKNQEEIDRQKLHDTAEAVEPINEALKKKDR